MEPSCVTALRSTLGDRIVSRGWEFRLDRGAVHVHQNAEGKFVVAVAENTDGFDALDDDVVVKYAHNVVSSNVVNAATRMLEEVAGDACPPPLREVRTHAVAAGREEGMLFTLPAGDYGLAWLRKGGLAVVWTEDGADENGDEATLYHVAAWHFG